MRCRKCVAVGILALSVAIALPAGAQERALADAKSASVEQALSVFLRVLDNLNWLHASNIIVP